MVDKYKKLRKLCIYYNDKNLVCREFKQVARCNPDKCQMFKKDYIEEMKAYTKKVTSSPERAREFLQRTGVYTASGNLKKAYR